MRYLILFIALLLAAPAAAEKAWSRASLRPGSCVSVAVANSESETVMAPLNLRGLVVTITMEPDSTGTGTGAAFSLQSCTSRPSAACLDYQFDSDGDGALDTKVLNGTAGQTGISNVEIAGSLLVSIDTNPGSGDTAELNICARR